MDWRIFLLNLVSSHYLIKPLGTLTIMAALSRATIVVFLNQVMKLARDKLVSISPNTAFHISSFVIAVLNYLPRIIRN